jgi:hypothetical protein
LLLAKHYNPLDWGQKQFEQVGQILGKKTWWVNKKYFNGEETYQK